MEVVATEYVATDFKLKLAMGSAKAAELALIPMHFANLEDPIALHSAETNSQSSFYF